MVFGREVAVVVKGRDGRTILFQSRGLDVQQASHAATEAMLTLQAAPQGADPLDMLSSLQSAPLLCGRLAVMHSSLAVTYRVAGGLVFLLVTPPPANTFSCVALLGAVVRLVTGPGEGGRAPDLTPERVQRRLGEIYLAVDALLGSCGVMDPAAAQARAQGVLDQLAGDKAGKGAPERPKTPPPQQQGAGRKTRRTLQGAIDQLALLSFSVGDAMQRVPPRPGFQLPPVEGGAGAGGTSPQSQAHAGAARDPFAPGQAAGPATTGAAAADPFGDDDIFSLLKGPPAQTPAAPAQAPPEAPVDPFAASDAVPAAWASFDKAAKDKAAAEAEAGTIAQPGAGGAGQAPAVGFEDDAFAPLGGGGVGGSALAGPPPPAPLVPSEPVLRLTELWRGEGGPGGGLVRAGLAGRVEWVAEGAKSKVHTVHFMVQPPEPGNEHLAAALTTARRHPACCRPGPSRGQLTADGILAKPHVGAPLMTYHLPPAACQHPLKAHLGSSWQASHDGRRLVTLGLHLMVHPRLAPLAAGMDVELLVPALIERPLRVGPLGAVYDGKTRTLRWQLAGPVKIADITGSVAEPFVASFLVGSSIADEGVLAAALARLSARVSLSGAPGTGTISGALLAQGVVELEWTPALCGWRAELTVTM